MRYFECLKFVQGKTILDIACGVGWGAYLFSKAGAKFVYGVDISRSVIHEANLFYKDQNIQYILGENAKIPLENDSIDVAISLETLEHVEDPFVFFKELNRVIRQDGFLILSSPNADLYKSRLKPWNPFHVDEYSRKQIENFANINGFIIEKYMGQYPTNSLKLQESYRIFIKKYWTLRNIERRYGLVGKIYTTIKSKIFVKYSHVNDPALAYNCSPVEINNDMSPAHHFFVFKKK